MSKFEPLRAPEPLFRRCIAAMFAMLQVLTISVTSSAQLGSGGFETGANVAEVSFSANDTGSLSWFATNERSAPDSGALRLQSTLAAPAAEGSFYALLQANAGAYSGAPVGLNGPFGETGAGRIYAALPVQPRAEYTLTFQHARGEFHAFCRGGGTSEGSSCNDNSDCPPVDIGECRESRNLSVVEIVDMAEARFCSGGTRHGALCAQPTDCPSGSCDVAAPDVDPAAATLAQHTFVTPAGTDWQTESFNFTTGPLTTSVAVALAVSGQSGATAAFDDVKVRNRTTHFTCYKAGLNTASGYSYTASPSPRMLCTPTNKNFEGLGNPVDHLTGYKLPVPSFEPLISQQVFNQFGSIFVDALKPELLMVPSEKLLGSPPAPGYTSELTDAFQCYRVRPSSGATFAPIHGVHIEDQFGVLSVDVLRPRRLCEPVGTVAHPEANPDDSLLCYLVRPSSKPAPPSDSNDIYVSNQFGMQPLRVDSPRELCVPSYRQEPCDDGIFCTTDRLVSYIPETDTGLDPQGNPEPTTTEVETTCVHEMRYGPAFGDWKIEPASGENISPCCEDDSDCDDADPCTFDRCFSSVHQCVFEERDPATCGTTPVAAFTPGPISECGPDEAIGEIRDLPCNSTEPIAKLCQMSCVPDSPNGDACPPSRWEFPTTMSRVAETYKVKMGGFADIHVHAFAEEAFGGRWMHGRVKPESSPAPTVCDGGWDHGLVGSIDPILSKVYSCALQKGNPFAMSAIVGVTPLASVFGPMVMSEMFSKTEGTAGDSGRHQERKYSPAGWTRWDSIVHHRVREDQLRAAHKQGFRLMVIELFGQKTLCEVIGPKPGNICTEMGDARSDIDRQIAAVRAFAASNSWVRIVTTPEEAIYAISKQQLALVLAIETTHLFNGTLNASSTEAEIDAAVGEYYDKGVRVLQIVHMTDSLFAGASQADETAQLLQFVDNPRGDGDGFECESEMCAGKTVYGFDVCEDLTDGLCKNEFGLTPAGEKLVNVMMARKMLIDLSHTSERAMQRVWEKARDNRYYPLFFSHTVFREIVTPEEATEYTVPAWMVQRVRRTGGMIGLRTGAAEMRTYTPPSPHLPVANDCAGSSRSLAQAYQYGFVGLKVPMALGSDLNAPAQHVRPRFIDNDLPGEPRSNRNGACSAGFQAEGICQSKKQSVSTKRGTGFDTRGLADVSFERDLMLDMDALGLGDDVNPLMDNSAEEYVRMWMRARDEEPVGIRKGPAHLANDMNVSGVGAYIPIGTRQESFDYGKGDGRQCFQVYCKDSVPMGGECKFNGECMGGLKCGGIGLCGLVKGKCVCDDESATDCGPDKFCKKGWPFNAVDNECWDKREIGAKCWQNKWCKSGDCGLFFKCVED